jgi:hypothetical protein
VVPPYFSVKEAVFPFNKFPGVDPVLGPEMRSTGEVMGVGHTFAEAFVKSQLAAGVRLVQPFLGVLGGEFRGPLRVGIFALRPGRARRSDAPQRGRLPAVNGCRPLRLRSYAVSWLQRHVALAQGGPASGVF